MRVSEYYRLGRKQPSLDFVDVDIRGDTKMFVDPRALRLLPSRWGDECVSLIQQFFQTVLKAIKRKSNEEAKNLLQALKEPNETHLGLSQDKARGHALGCESSTSVWEALTESEAAKSGLLEDLEDTILMVEGVSTDIVSDIAINIIREPLIVYTQQICKNYEILMEEEVASGPLWDPEKNEWYQKFVSLPVTEHGKLLFVPKAIVRRRMDYDADEYFRYYILEYMQEMELHANTELVRLIKDGKSRKVTKKDLMEKYGRGKHLIVQETLKNPDLLNQYREDKKRVVKPPLSHIEIADVEGTDVPDWNNLLNETIGLEKGKEHCYEYEKAIEALLTALFYPNLVNPQVQRNIHDGRKRIDITYTNAAVNGFFYWLSRHYPVPHVFVECKNYAQEISNPELDQLSGRFSPSRGQFGIIVCRSFNDKILFHRRCKDTALDSRGYIIPLDDEDLKVLVQNRSDDFGLLKNYFDNLTM